MVKTPACKWLKYRLFYATVGFNTDAAANPSREMVEPRSLSAHAVRASTFPHKEKLALIMASATPAADVSGQSTELMKDKGVWGLRPHSGWPKVADAVIETVAPGIPKT